MTFAEQRRDFAYHLHVFSLKEATSKAQQVQKTNNKQPKKQKHRNNDQQVAHTHTHKEDTYFDRLWCHLELATFARYGAVENVDVLPLWLAPWLLASILLDLLSASLLDLLEPWWPSGTLYPPFVFVMGSLIK